MYWCEQEVDLEVLKSNAEKLNNLLKGTCQLILQERKTLIESFFKVTVNKDNWRGMRCTCVSFLKNDECKHSLALVIRLKLTVPPLKAQNSVLGLKPKRGRASKAKKALVLQ